MGSLTVSKIDRLYWMGRYAERVNTSLRAIMDYYDRLIDGTPMPHEEICTRLAIPDIYENDADFAYRFTFDAANPDSLTTAADRMLGNGMMLRETISSRTLAYLQLAVNSLKDASTSSAPVIEAQQVIDYIMAFRGSFDDGIADESIRDIIKLGFNVEKLSLYLRLGYPDAVCLKEINKLLARVRRAPVRTSSSSFAALLKYADPMEAAKLSEDRNDVIKAVEDLIEF